jgi:hypothetical protein
MCVTNTGRLQYIEAEHCHLTVPTANYIICVNVASNCRVVQRGRKRKVRRRRELEARLKKTSNRTEDSGRVNRSLPQAAVPTACECDIIHLYVQRL